MPRRARSIRTELLRVGPEFVEVRARGRYGESPLSWTIDYLIDVDGFTKVTVGLTTAKPVQLRWNCFNHALPGEKGHPVPHEGKRSGQVSPSEVGPSRPFPLVTPEETSRSSNHIGMPSSASANRVSGIEFSKQDFADRYGGYRDSAVSLENGKVVDTGAVETQGRTPIEELGRPGHGPASSPRSTCAIAP